MNAIEDYKVTEKDFLLPDYELSDVKATIFVNTPSIWVEKDAKAIITIA